MAEAVSTALAPKIGRSAAHDVLPKATKRAKEEKCHLALLLRNMPEVTAEPFRERLTTCWSRALPGQCAAIYRAQAFGESRMPEVENAAVRLCPISVAKNMARCECWETHLDRTCICGTRSCHVSRADRVIRFDTRGHGKSSVPPGPYSLEDLGRDVLFLLDSLGVECVNFGLFAWRHGCHVAGVVLLERVRRLVMANTCARIDTREMWDERMPMVKKSGMAPLADITPTRWFTSRYREGHVEEMERVREMIATMDWRDTQVAAGVLRDTI